MGVSILTTNEKGKCYTRTPLFASFNTSSALHIFIFSVSYRPMRMSASTDADVCADRCGCLRRPMRMSAPTDADVCVDRCGWHELMFCTCRGCTYRGCTCLKCTNQSRTAPISQELHKSAKNSTNQPRTTQHLPLLVHLRQVHPLNNCTPQTTAPLKQEHKKGVQLYKLHPLTTYIN